jgi:multiple sugar transport system ATP-binding protein
MDAYIDLDEMMGSEIYLYLTYAGQKLIARVPSRVNAKADENIELAIDTKKIHVFDKETQQIICR